MVRRFVIRLGTCVAGESWDKFTGVDIESRLRNTFFKFTALYSKEVSTGTASLNKLFPKSLAISNSPQ